MINELLFKTLAFTGGAVLIAMVVILVYGLIDFIRDAIRRAKQTHRRRHRFDKKPTAKCYCIDCVYRNSGVGSCGKGNVNHCYDAFFCEDAEPTRYERDD